jgi:hypothetical protein
MKYLILIHSNPHSRARWETLSEEERDEFGRGHAALTKALRASGILVAAEGLPDLSAAKRVSVRDGQIIASDGPFAEVKEYLAGFYLIDCDSPREAIEHAARVPDAQFGDVEVRPVLDLSQYGM